MFNTDIEKRLNGMLKLSKEVGDGTFSMQVLQDEIIDLIIDLNNELPKEETEEK